MIQADVYGEWQKLCEEHDAARDSYLKAFVAVNAKFRAIGEGNSSTNPTTNELGAFEETWSACEDIKRRMDEFVKMHAKQTTPKQ
jgi:hypothetical protein